MQASTYMKVVMRLYRMHDMDLIALYKHKQFNFRNALRYALKNYIYDNPKKMLAPTAVDLSETEFRSCYRFIISFDDEKDSDVIELLLNVKPRYRNSFLKNILRYSLVGMNVSVYSSLSSEYIKENKLLLKNKELYSECANPALKAKYKEKKAKEKDTNISINKKSTDKKDSNKNKNTVTFPIEKESSKQNKEEKVLLKNNTHNILNSQEEIKTSLIHNETSEKIEEHIDDEFEEDFFSKFNNLMNNF